MPSRRKKLLASGLTVAILLLATGLALWLWPGGDEPTLSLPGTAEAGFAFMTSEEFARLPDYRQEAYRREVQRLIAAMPAEQRAALFAKYRGSADMIKGLRQLEFNPIRPAMKDYFGVPVEQRKAVLDKYIDQMERFRALGGLGRPAESGGAGGRPQATPEMRDYMRARLEAQIQEGNPQETAQMMEFMKAFRARRIERGLPVP